MDLAWEVLRISTELTLGVGLKLLCDNGRISFEDIKNDFLFWLPGMNPQQPADGLTREAEALFASRYTVVEIVAEPELEHVQLAAK